LRCKWHGRRSPSHEDIDAVDIAAFLPNIILVKMGHNPFRF
jgi:hypothetical protein